MSGRKWVMCPDCGRPAQENVIFVRCVKMSCRNYSADVCDEWIKKLMAEESGNEKRIDSVKPSLKYTGDVNNPFESSDDDRTPVLYSSQPFSDVWGLNNDD